MAVPSPDILLRLKYLGNPTTVAYTDTAARNSSALSAGIYEIISTTDCFFLQGSSTVTATSSSNPLYAMAPRLLYVEVAADAYISAIRSSTSGTLYIIARSS